MSIKNLITKVPTCILYATIISRVAPFYATNKAYQYCCIDICC